MKRKRLPIALLVLLPFWGCGQAPLCNLSPAEPFQGPDGTFVVIGDTQQFAMVEWFMGGGPKMRARVREQIRRLDPGAIFLAGDSVGAGSINSFWKEWRKEYAGLHIFPVIGNHDLHGPDRPALEHYFETFPFLDGRRWYDVRQGAILFLMADSNRGNMQASEWEAQMRWLDERLAAAESDPGVRCVALVVHHPPVSASWGGGSADSAAMVARAAQCRKFRVCFSGHHHDYQHLQDDRRHLFVTGGGGSPTYYRRSGRLPEGVRLVEARRSHHVLFCRRIEEGLRIEMHELGKDGSWSIAETVELRF